MLSRKKRQRACVIMVKRQLACAIMEKRQDSMCYHGKKTACAITGRRQIACVIKAKILFSSFVFQNSAKISYGSYKPQNSDFQSPFGKSNFDVL